jgi:hypothetical protein
MSGTQERPSGPDWRGGCAGRSRKRAQHPPQPEGETHLFFACIIRWPDRRGSTWARDRIKLNRGWEGAGIGDSTSGDRALKGAERCVSNIFR